ncbi:MAG: class I tRNA ligase family protein, partial [Candidatus Eremiobacteraeota bacterium]|nr:class I tRNA ligase family protein [Candidatus Eremiobacteraeota bacterium]
IRDWNVSRQIWWGHQLPVWYTSDGREVVAESEAEALELSQRDYGTRDLRRDSDTLDTWFSSSIWPFSILGWPQATPELRCWYPSQVLVTAGEIIFLWVARMIMLGIHFMGRIPFGDALITPTVFDRAGRKMSKSLGNAIDPMNLAEKYGADAVRMSILRQMRLDSQELRYQESRCEEARNFNNKIWNATRYLLALPEGLPRALVLPPSERLTLADRWILTRLRDAILAVTESLGRYDFGDVAEALWRFIWYEFCDWYVESTKAASSRETRAAVLSFVWNNAMRLLHPVAPFISEEVWLALPHDGPTIMTSAWPDALEVPGFEDAADFLALQAAVERIRNARAEFGLHPRDRIVVEIPANVPAEVAELLALLASGTAERCAATGQTLAEALAAVAVRAPRGALEARYRKELETLHLEIERGERKLSNAAFVARAPADVVAKEREKLDGYRNELRRVETALHGLKEPA